MIIGSSDSVIFSLNTDKFLYKQLLSRYTMSNNWLLRFKIIYIPRRRAKRNIILPRVKVNK